MAFGARVGFELFAPPGCQSVPFHLTVEIAGKQAFASTNMVSVFNLDKIDG